MYDRSQLRFDSRLFDLHDQEGLAESFVEDLGQCRDGLATHVQLLQLLKGELGDGALTRRCTIDGEVMHKHRDAVAARLHVDLDSVGPEFDRLAYAGEGILRSMSTAGCVGDDERSHTREYAPMRTPGGMEV
jgi:hypothetical protein